MMILLLIILSIVALFAIAVTIGKEILKRKFRNHSNVLLSHSKNISDRIFTYEVLAGLPLPVQQYFKYVLNEGQRHISNVSFRHNGQFKTALEKDWINITGEHFATMEKPGFIWKGTTSMFTALDMYVEDKGRLVVALFSIYNIVDAKGKNYDQGELMRWLGESVLYPTNLLPDDRLEWTAIDTNHAKLTFTYNGMSLPFTITFKENGEITQMETKRYMNENSLETWIIQVANYKKMNGVIIPTRFEVIWRLQQGDFSYARFNIQQLSYNK